MTYPRASLPVASAASAPPRLEPKRRRIISSSSNPTRRKRSSALVSHSAPSPVDLRRSSSLSRRSMARRAKKVVLPEVATRRGSRLIRAKIDVRRPPGARDRAPGDAAGGTAAGRTPPSFANASAAAPGLLRDPRRPTQRTRRRAALLDPHAHAPRVNVPAAPAAAPPHARRVERPSRAVCGVFHVFETHGTLRFLVVLLRHRDVVGGVGDFPVGDAEGFAVWVVAEREPARPPPIRAAVPRRRGTPPWRTRRRASRAAPRSVSITSPRVPTAATPPGTARDRPGYPEDAHVHPHQVFAHVRPARELPERDPTKSGHVHVGLARTEHS